MACTAILPAILLYPAGTQKCCPHLRCKPPGQAWRFVSPCSKLPVEPAYFARHYPFTQDILCAWLHGSLSADTGATTLKSGAWRTRDNWQERTPEPGKLAPKGLPCEDRREHAPPALLDAACRDRNLAIYIKGESHGTAQPVTEP